MRPVKQTHDLRLRYRIDPAEISWDFPPMIWFAAPRMLRLYLDSLVKKPCPSRRRVLTPARVQPWQRVGKNLSRRLARMPERHPRGGSGRSLIVNRVPDMGGKAVLDMGVRTENLIRVDDVMESPKLAE